MKVREVLRLRTGRDAFMQDARTQDAVIRNLDTAFPMRDRLRSELARCKLHDARARPFGCTSRSRFAALVELIG